MNPALRTACCILLTATLGCATVRPVASPSTYMAQHRPDRVWVADANGEVFQLMNPTLQGDSVTGTLAGTTEPLTLQLTSERTLLARQPSSGKTAQLVGVIALVAGLAIYGLIVGGGGDKVCATPGSRGCPLQ